MLYKKCKLSGQTPTSAFHIHSSSVPYSHPDKKEGRYQVPQSGKLSAAFSLAWRDDEDDMWGFARAVHLMLGPGYTYHSFLFSGELLMVHCWREFFS